MNSNWTTPRRRITRWSEQEERDLIEGVKLHGLGQWNEIMSDRRLNFHRSRTAVDLKDKWRVMSARLPQRANPPLFKSRNLIQDINESSVDNSPRRARLAWSESEEKDLIEGVRKFGCSQWINILSDSKFNFAKERTSVDLKDKWRVLSSRRSSKANQPAYRSIEIIREAQREGLLKNPLKVPRVLIADTRLRRKRKERESQQEEIIENVKEEEDELESDQEQLEEEKGYYEVDTILDEAIDPDTGKRFYLIQWKGYDSQSNTWEPEENLENCRAKILAFHFQQNGQVERQRVEEHRRLEHERQENDTRFKRRRLHVLTDTETEESAVDVISENESQQAQPVQEEELEEQTAQTPRPWYLRWLLG